MRRAFCLTLFGLLSSTPPAVGQSLFGSQGLGMLVEPLDARARALGTMGVGLLGPSLTSTDPASAARIFLPTGQITIQPQWIDGDLGGQRLNTKATRFPQLGMAYPIAGFGGTALLQVGSYLDQRWEVEVSSEQEFRGASLPVTDVFESNGGISTFQVGWAQRIGDRFSLGVGAGARIGSVTRTFTRVIEAEEGFAVVPFKTKGEWKYSGLTATVGFQWDPIRALRLGGTVNWSGDLEAEPVGDSEGETESFALPTELRLGASGILTSRLAVSAGFSYADWKGSGEFLGPETVAGTVLSYGGGLEWAGPTLGLRNFPIRLGVKRADLPFKYDGETPKESVVSGGIGLTLVPPATGLVGAIDLAFERGTREASDLSESFWRVTATFRVGSF